MNAPWPFVGNAEVGLRFRDALLTDSLAQSVCVYGPRGLGKGSAVLWSIQTALCTSGDVRPCGSCAHCTRFIRFEHERCVVVHPEGDTISVETVRTTVSRFLYTNRERQWLVIERAECLTESAQNMLLKFLEEPPTSVRIIMTCEHPHRLQSTVRSRLASWFWHRVPDRELRGAFPSAEALDILEADGRPLQLQKRLAIEGRQELRDRARQSAMGAFRRDRVPDITEEDLPLRFSMEVHAVRNALYEALGMKTADILPKEIDIPKVVAQLRRYIQCEQPQYKNVQPTTMYAYVHLR